ncbi:hypothetical protein NW752_011162 [Fusarium irregulare]|uniref:BZIP domain-containing protein n=1 Tax=Fusarium irregulare TaxID=2494466 RepID=A0A9W8U3Z7_9HYPO|nr:hypothetical protein NW766_012191 [Fusarium irregulare]KAJ4005832.1 hypothetical protein NW752_011162 [Fusarium irregulare]
MGTVYPGYQQQKDMQVFDSYAPAPDLTPGMNSYGMLPDGNWGQWWSPGDAAFAESANATAPDVYTQEQQFPPNYTLDQATPTQWDSPATSIHSYPVPSPSTEVTSVDASPGDESRRGSQSDQRKRKRNTATATKFKAEPRQPATRSTRRTSAKKASKAEPAPPAEKPKRGSKSKASAKQIKQEALEEEAQDAEGEHDEHNKKIQERNRIASNKFRVKKREDARKLRADEEDMERVNRDLSNCVSDLTLQVYDLKMKLLQHTDCKCHLIQDYIATEAQKYIKDLGDGKHPNTTPAFPPPHMFQQQHHHAQ